MVGVEVAGPLVAAANLVRTHMAEAKKSEAGSVEALMAYSEAIEQAIHSLVNEARTILVLAATGLDDDAAMQRLRLRIDTYLAVHTVYLPLKDAKVAALATLDLLDKKAQKLLKLADLHSKKRNALLGYRQAFTDVLRFIDELESATMYLKSGTGLVAPQMTVLKDVTTLDRAHRLENRDEVDTAVKGGFAELDHAFVGLTERLVSARMQVSAAFG